MQNATDPVQHASFEALERRRFLSTVNIVDHGAIANDGRDDMSAISAAVNASSPGDTILFSGGTFDLRDEMVLPDDRTYRGENGATLRGDGADGQLLKFTGDDIAVRGLTFDGGGLFFDKPGGGRNTNIIIDNNRFLMKTSGLHKNGITFTSGLNDSDITNNYFTGYNGGFAIYGYNYLGLTIANNEIINTTAGMHIDAFGVSGNLLVEQNFISGAKGMGMEFQSTATNLVFQDNWYEKPAFVTAPGSSNGNTMAYSLILDKSKNIIIRRNAAIMPIKHTTGSDYTRIAFEVGGDNTLVEDNYSFGGNHVLAVNDGVGSASVTVRNNKFLDYAQGIGFSFPAAGRTVKQSNNGADVDLSWDLDRGKPGRNKRLGLHGLVSEDGEADPSTPDGETDPSEPDPSASEGKPRWTVDDFKYLSDMSWNSAESSWGPVERDMNNGKSGEEDGGRMRIGDKNYLKGLGVAGDSSIAFKLDKKYTRFFCDIGVDEYAGSNGSVTFQVWVDGKLKYDSGLMTGDTLRKGITINVEGAKRLRLVTTDGNDGQSADHANWGGARLLPKD